MSHRRPRVGAAAVALVVVASLVALFAGSEPAVARAAACSPDELVLDGGSGQTAQLGKQFGTNLQVKLANSSGCTLSGDLAGINVDFVAPAGRASGTFSSTGTNVAVVGTNSSGVATAPAFTANDTAGSYSVHAESDYGTVKLYLSNTASGLAASISSVGAASQEAAVNMVYPAPLQARVTDAGGNAIQGATVSFQAVTGATGAGGSFLGGQATATTGSDGIATAPPLLANTTPGRFTVVASVAGVSAVATYMLDNHAATQTISASTASAEASAVVDGRFAAPLQARVLDASGQPVEGASVTFTIVPAASGGAAGGAGAGADFLGGGTQATELTGADGVASSPPLLANTTSGAFSAVATTGGAAPVTYGLRNLAAEPDTITVGAASGESTWAGSRFPIRLAVTVDDSYGNPVAGATVSFRAPKRGPGGHFTSRRRAAGKTLRRASRTVDVKTNRNGIAVAPPFTANRTAGGYIVTATVKGRTHVAFALLNLARSGG
jgi:protocatechuate 3,4-dioxygenase beta subunit